MEDEKLNEWDEVNEKIKISRIKRMPWKEIFGESLTARIHRLRNKGHNSDETFSILIRSITLKSYCEKNPLEVPKLLDNLKISICARYGESKTAGKIWREGRDEKI